jgi:hypothetical protein
MKPIKVEEIIQNQDKYLEHPLWCVYGPDCFPTLLCFKLRYQDVGGYNDICIWGYSVYKKVPGFRTLGTIFSKWAKENSPKIFDSQEQALEYLKKITNPRCS